MKRASANTDMLIHPCRWVLLMAGLLLQTGCIVLPTPHMDTGETRRNIGSQTPAQFKPGKTTRTDVLLTLGEPDATSVDERKIAYHSQKMVGVLLVGGYGTGAAAPLTKDDYLVCEFDARGRLVKVERSSHWLGSEDLERKVGAVDTLTRDHGRIRMDTRASWLSGVDDYRTKGFAGAQWIDGRLVLTDTHLRFASRGDFGNAPPVLSVPLRSITAVTEDRIFTGSLLAVQTREGKYYAFQIWGDHKWTIDREKQREIVAMLNRR